MSIFPITAYVINLKRRTDRWEAIQNEFKKTALIRLERFDAIDLSEQHSIAWHCCALSHQAVIQMAKTRHLPWVLILEDDATIAVPDFDARFRQHVQWLMSHMQEWECYKGGVTGVNLSLLVAPIASSLEPPADLMYVKGQAAHFQLYNASAYDKILALPLPSDAWDVLMRNHLLSVCGFPMLSRQAVIKSDLTDSWDYNTYFNNADRLVLSVMKR